MANLLKELIIPNPHFEPNLQGSINTTTKPLSNKLTKAYSHLRTYPNEQYSAGLKTVPLCSCLLYNNVNTKNPQNEWVIKTQPKWNIDLLETTLDHSTGELIQTGIYTTNDLKSGNNRKIKALNRFCDKFQPLYDKRKITIWFITLTLANQSKTDIRGLLNSYKTRLQRNGINIAGSIWILEISPDLHIHYHLLLSTNRINIKGTVIPEYLKPNDLWGCRTQIDFAQKHIRGYLGKYFVKNNSRIIGKRTYGIVLKEKSKIGINRK